MNDLILTSLANRKHSFWNKIFRVDPDFYPYIPSASEANLRRLLALDDRSTDYHLVALLAAIEAYPHVKERFQETRQSWDLEEYLSPPSQIIGAAMAEDVAFPGKFLPRASGWPSVLEWRVFFEPHPTFILSPRARTPVSYRDAGGGIYEIFWPEWLPISGGLMRFMGVWGEVEQPWNVVPFAWGEDADRPHALFQHHPAQPDYAALAAKLQASAAALEVMSRHRLAGSFDAASHPVEKCALAALAAGLSNTGVYGG